jgi:glycosyltransferase involved in cell wall biosynthesis
MKKILYISTLCSHRLWDYIFKTASIKPSQAEQKFNSLLAEGLALQDKSCCVETLSAIPITSENHKKCIWNIPSEVVGNMHYNYVPILNYSIVKNIIVFIYSFFKIVLWSLINGREDKLIICDALNLSITTAALCACKLTRTKTIGIVTDVPNLMITEVHLRNSVKHKIYITLVAKIIEFYDGYILLTEQMNNVVNLHHKPNIILEGLVDANMVTASNLLENKSTERILIYAGLIYERYGVKKLIEAFLKLESDDLRLHIYGAGEMEKDMPHYMRLDNRIVYQGVVPNDIVVKRQLEATLLINPRSSTEEFARYSFPSKNMEYMVSGTPIVTAPLPGMPLEYNPFVYLFKDESVDGIYQTLKSLLLKPREELHEFGCNAKQFVLTHKSNFIQAGRVIELMDLLINHK